MLSPDVPACLRRTKLGKSRGTNGFTLLEAIVSVAIMAVGLVAIIEAYGTSMRLSLQDEYLTTATLLASGKMEEVLKEPYITPGEDEGDFGPEFEAFRWRVEIADSDIQGLETITVTVTWTVGKLNDELRLTSAAPRREREQTTGTVTGSGAPNAGGIPG